MSYISAILTNKRKTVRVWIRDSEGKRIIKEFDAPYYFYVPDDNGIDLDIKGNRIRRIDFENSFKFFDARKKYEARGIKLYESDIQPQYKILSKEFYGKDINPLNITFFDIEVDYDKNIGYSSTDNPYAPINSIALYHQHTDKTVVLAVPPPNRADYTQDSIPLDISEDATVIICEDEAQLLKLFFKEITDSDIISGWNSEFFDVPYIYERANIALFKGAGDKLGFPNSRKPFYREVSRYGNTEKALVIAGRVHLDYLDIYKNFEMAGKPSYKLEHVADDELPHLPKLKYSGSLYDLYRDDFDQFLRYNVRDTVILKGLEDKKKYIETAVQMSHMATSQTADVLGTIKIAECSIINFCHYDKGVRVPDHKPPEATGEKYSGATVIDPKIGMHDYSASVDLVSLYPGIMRSLNISPETIMGQFTERGEAFAMVRDESDRKSTFIMEDTGEIISATGKQWRRILVKKNWAISGLGTIFDLNDLGVIPAVLTKWFFERKDYKKKMWGAKQAGDTVLEEFYDRMQYIIKIQLNSMYGACGSRFFKFYDVRLAESTTLTGREVLYHMARKIAEKINGNYDMEDDSIIYGDTDSVYFKTYKDNAQDALDLANSVCDGINASYPEFMNRVFLIDDERSKIMEAEQEIVSDRGIYIEKKYYMLHIVASDGEFVDKMKFMGVPIKTTKLPAEIKDKLSEFIERLLKGEDWDIIGPEVVYFKDILFGLNDISLLGTPKGVNKVETNTEIFNSGTDERKKIAGHCRASILWNKCLKTYNDTESPRIISGNKILVYNLTCKIDNFFTSIAVPNDIDTPPTWFWEHFAKLVDKEAQVKRLVDDPMRVMITAAGIKVPTKKKLIFEEGLFG